MIKGRRGGDNSTGKMTMTATTLATVVMVKRGSDEKSREYLLRRIHIKA